MGTAGLDLALQRGAPLLDVVVRLAATEDHAAATERINALADDFELHPGDWYDQPGLRIGSATKEALDRLFGWRLIRVPLERQDPKTGAWGAGPGLYRWEELNSPQLHLFPIPGLIQSIGCTQPGADDQGQWYE